MILNVSYKIDIIMAVIISACETQQFEMELPWSATCFRTFRRLAVKTVIEIFGLGLIILAYISYFSLSPMEDKLKIEVRTIIRVHYR